MLKFLTHKLRTHSINEDNFVADENHDSGTESDDEIEDQEFSVPVCFRMKFFILFFVFALLSVSINSEDDGQNVEVTKPEENSEEYASTVESIIPVSTWTCRKEQYQYFVIFHVEKLICSGSLVHRNWILTIKECCNIELKMHALVGERDIWFDFSHAIPITHLNFHPEHHFCLAKLQYLLPTNIPIMQLATPKDWQEIKYSRASCLVLGYLRDNLILKSDETQCLNMTLMPPHDDTFISAGLPGKYLDGNLGAVGGPFICGNIQYGMTWRTIGYVNQSYQTYLRVDVAYDHIKAVIKKDEEKKESVTEINTQQSAALSCSVNIVLFIFVLNTYVVEYLWFHFTLVT